jgi:hypothetical protein
MSLNDHIHQLSRPHLRTAPDGSLRHAPALLDELRAAVTPGHAGSAGGGTSGPPIPINPNALDLLTEIETEARRDYFAMTEAPWSGDLDALLIRFTMMDMTQEWDNYLTHVTSDWVDRITAMLWPVRPRRKLTGKVCPACGWATYGDERKVCLSLGCWDDDGNMRKIGEWDIECASCEAGWAGDQVAYLLRALDTPTIEQEVNA